MSDRCSTSRIWVFLTCVFLLTTLAGVGYIIWKEVIQNRNKNTEQMVVRRFPAFFRTAEQQRVFEQQYFNVTNKYTPVKTNVTDDQTCLVNCSFTKFGPVKQVSGVTFHHACCRSVAAFMPKSSLTNFLGQVKTIAQFQGKKQFFKIENCSHVVTFRYGRCSQHQEYVTAVTVDEAASDDDDDKYKLDWVEVPGCCKCLNVGN